MNSQFEKYKAPGLAICGTSIGCGKTVVTTGLAAALQQEGISARAMKTVFLCDRKSAVAELQFIETISRTPANYRTLYVNEMKSVSQGELKEALAPCLTGVESTLVELPGSCATPLTKPGLASLWHDSADLAALLGFPCVLVTKFGSESFQDLILNWGYLANHGVTVVGFVANKVEPDLGRGPSPQIADNWQMALQKKTGVPFLGTLDYSPSLSVPRVNQGNLIKTIETALDLLPLLRVLNPVLV